MSASHARARGNWLFLCFSIAAVTLGYLFLTREVTADFDAVAKEFRVMAFRDGKPQATTLAGASGQGPGVTYLLPTDVVEVPGGDQHRATVLERGGDWQLVRYEYANGISSASRYRAFRDRIVPVSHRVTFHAGLMALDVLFAIPAWIASLAVNWLWTRLEEKKSPRLAQPAPQVPKPRRSRLDVAVRIIAVAAVVLILLATFAN